MESKIKIDLNEQNQPIIVIEWKHSEDLRDKVVKLFLETFRGESITAKFFYAQDRAIIEPVSPTDAATHAERQLELLKQQK